MLTAIEEAAIEVVEANARYYNARGNEEEAFRYQKRTDDMGHATTAAARRLHVALDKLEQAVLHAREENQKHDQYVTKQKNRRDTSDQRFALPAIEKARAVFAHLSDG